MYSTLDDLKLLMTEKDLLQCVDDERLGSLAGNTVALARVAKVIEWADAEIDAKARAGGYTVPLTDTALANSLSVRLAMCILIAGRKALKSEARDELCKAAREQLTAIAKGELAPAESAGESRSEVQEGERRATLDGMEGL